jgi:N-acetylmuramoyl-L-alanine amidase
VQYTKLQYLNVFNALIFSRSVKNLKQYFVYFVSVFFLFSFTKGNQPSGIKTIVIDPGHGGLDPGCHGVSSKEKDIALAVALRLGKLIEENLPDVKVIYTRSTDVFVDLEERAQIANKAKADLFISIHCNAAGMPLKYKDPKTGKKKIKMRKNKKGKLVPVETINPVPFGTETYVMGLKNEEGKMRVATRENSVMLLENDYEKKYGGFDPESLESYIIMSNYTSAYVIQSANLAVKIQDEYTKKAGRIDKGVHRQSLWVLWRTSMPSILTEIGYLTNPLEETFLAAENGQDYLAKSIFRGLRKYKDEFEGNKKTYNDEIENQTPIENENLKAGNLPNQIYKDDDEEEEKPKDTVAKKSFSISPTKNFTTSTNGLDANTTTLIATSSITTNSTSSVYSKLISKLDGSVKDSIIKKEPAVKVDSSMLKKKNSSPSPIPEIIFKVQFASSDVPLNLYEDKYGTIKDTSMYMVGALFKYTSGKFSTFQEALLHQNSLRAAGFNDSFVVAFSKGKRMDILEAKKLSPK